MSHGSLAPNVTVTIGHQTRIYFAFVTTAPVELDAPATVTLHSATFSEVMGFAAEPPAYGSDGTVARLILVDALEFGWHRARSRGRYVLRPADPVLVGLGTLQRWLWHRLQAASPPQVAA